MAIQGDFKGTTQSSFQVEKGGVRLKHVAGALEVRSADDSALVAAHAITATPGTNTTQLATTEFVTTKSSGSFVAQSTTPSSPVAGLRWLETSTGVLYTYFDGFWVEFNAKLHSDLETVFSDPQITRVGVATGDTSATLPAHQIGDLIIGFAFRDGSTTNPTLPAGWTSVSSRDGTSCSATLGYKIAESAAETTGTWTNASNVAFVVYRNCHATGVFDSAWLSGTTNTINYDGANLTTGSSRTWVVAFAGHRSIDTSLQTAPTQLTNVATAVNATSEIAIHDTNAEVSTFTNTSVAVGGTASGWITETLTIEPLANPSTYLDFPSGPSVDQEYSYSNLTWIWNGTGWRYKEPVDTHIFTSSGTWDKPAGASLVWVQLWSGGGGGGGGAESSSSGHYALGGAGGAGGGYTAILLNPDQLATTVSVVIGAGGTGGVGGGSPANGIAGGSTSFGTIVQSGGVGGGAGNSGVSAALSNTSVSTTALLGETGSGGGRFTSSTANTVSTNPMFAGSGGGAGGGGLNNDTVIQPTAGGYRLLDQTVGGTAGTSNVNTSGTAGGNGADFCGGGGGGAAVRVDSVVSSASGGNGGRASGGGGGGGLESSGTAGNGGNGGNGYAIITTFF